MQSKHSSKPCLIEQKKDEHNESLSSLLYTTPVHHIMPTLEPSMSAKVGYKFI